MQAQLGPVHIPAADRKDEDSMFAPSTMHVIFDEDEEYGAKSEKIEAHTSGFAVQDQLSAVDGSVLLAFDRSYSN
jgi:hypothetical protein